MKFNLKIKNLGKLTDANIRIGGFTVFAGPNNTGKSFVSKLLYSLFDGMNANHVAVYLNELIHPLQRAMKSFEFYLDRGGNKSGQSPFLHLEEKLQTMEKLVEKCANTNPDYAGEFDALESIYPEFVDAVKDMTDAYDSIMPDLESMVSNGKLLSLGPILGHVDRESPLENIDNAIQGINAGILNREPGEIITVGIGHKIRQNLIQNFQISSLVDIRNRKEQTIDVDIDGFGQFNVADDFVRFTVEHDGLEALQNYSRVIYLESPIHWKLKKVLSGARNLPRFYFSLRRRQLSGVPGYFYDLVNAIESQYTEEVDFPDLLDKLTGKEVLGGKLVTSNSGVLLFQESERQITLPLTATGVVNLGILALLIERKVIDKGSVIFIDEPEAHLHPAWQVVMADALFELSRHGVTVVIATHSADILKWLEVQVKKHPDDERLVTLNQFLSNGSVSDEEDFSTKLASIKEELTKPFANLYVGGL